MTDPIDNFVAKLDRALKEAGMDGPPPATTDDDADAQGDMDLIDFILDLLPPDDDDR